MNYLTISLFLVAFGPGAEGVAMQDVIRGNNQFAFDLYGKLRDRPGNQIISPFSISTALAMTQVGANGNTAKEMAKTLHLPADAKVTDEGFGNLLAQIAGEGGARPYQLITANALWGQEGLTYRPEFLKRTEASYGARLHPVDFQSDPEAARKLINSWVEKQTQDKIKDLLASSSIQPGTDLILTNAIYFKGAWLTPFPKAATRDEPFGDGKTTLPVPTMHLTSHFGYLETDEFQGLDVPYVGNDLSMMILLPKKVDALASVESSLSVARLEDWLKKLARKQVQVALPRFKLESAVELAGVLGALGMSTAFGPKADFSGMTTDRPLFLSSVIHKAFTEVNEEGTEAAAATAGIMRTTSMMVPQPPIVFRADHPFLFLIRDARSGSILFLGRVIKP